MSKYQAIKNDYLGSGVVKVKRISDQTVVACKTISYNEGHKKAKKHAESEYRILSQLHHPNITQFIDAQWRPNQLRLYMEYYPDGTLDNLIVEKRIKSVRFSESYVWSIIWQLSTALSYCHTGLMILPANVEEPHAKESGDALRILHRDIKPANVFVSSRSETALGAIKLGDFGLSAILLDDQDPSTYVGTRIYKPPEISQTNSVQQWTENCDVFSLGCTLYEICHLHHTYDDPVTPEMDAAEWTAEGYSANLKDLVRQCIDAEPARRPSARDITRLTHEKMKATPQYELALKNHKLLLAVRLGDFDRVRQLLDEGAEAYAENAKDRETSLHLAAKSGVNSAADSRKLALLPLLVAKGAKVGAKSVRGETPLHSAAGAGSGSMVQVVLDEGAKINARDDKGYCAIHTAAGAGNLDALSVLLEHGEYPELLTDGYNRMTPLQIAAANGHKEIVQCLLDKGVNTDAFTTNGKTALHLAAEEGHVSALTMLIKAGSNTNMLLKDNSGNTALHRAAATGNAHVVESLINHDCNTRMSNANDETALHLAASRGHDVIVKLLVKTKVSIRAAAKVNRLQALHLAAKAGHRPVVKTLLEAKANIESRTLEGETALHLASRFGRKSVVQELLMQKAQVDALGSNATMPLHLAAASGQEDIVQILLEHGAKMDAQTNDGMSPLHIAVLYNRLKVVQVLVDRGADLSLRNGQGETALKLSRNKRHGAVVQVLVDQDAPEDLERNVFGKAADALSRVFL